jgi:hypothetical protein
MEANKHNLLCSLLSANTSELPSIHNLVLQSKSTGSILSRIPFFPVPDFLSWLACSDRHFGQLDCMINSTACLFSWSGLNNLCHTQVPKNLVATKNNYGTKNNNNVLTDSYRSQLFKKEILKYCIFQ